MDETAAEGETVKTKMTPFPSAFYVANVMEIFERMAWYGFFALSSLYMTSPIAQGGLGFDSIQRGILQGIIPFLLYLFPVITGALADRYGYRNTFIVAFAILTPAYFLLGQFHSFWGFFGAFLLVAVGAATFKPVVVGTVARTTDDSNRGLGFGIFYMIVNVGGFIGPIIAGALRILDWNWVFVMLAATISINFIPTLFFYKEPTTESTSETKRSLKRVLLDAQEVLGNGRFALAVIPIVILFMLAGGDWLGWGWILGGSVIWVFINLLLNGWISLIIMLPYVLLVFCLGNYVTWSGGLAVTSGWQTPIIIALVWAVVFIALNMRGRFSAAPKQATEASLRAWHRAKPQIGNWPFVLYLLILAGFWTSFQQIFITMPEYIRDFVDTADIIRFAGIFGQGFVNFLTSVNVEQLAQAIGTQVAEHGAITTPEGANPVFYELVHYVVRVPHHEIMIKFQELAALGTPDEAALMAVATEWADKYRQVHPEYIINIDAGAIVLFQVLVSWIIQRWKPFPVLVVGTIVAGTGIALGGLSHGLAAGGFLAIMAIVIFAFGEMIASPKSQEYVARIAPRDKTALFMGYYFVTIAFGNLFGGILSGWGYQKIAREMGNPELMWFIFGCIGFLTAVALIFFNRSVVPKLEAQREANR